MTNKNIFRQVALNRLSSPEELDCLLQVTSAKGWIALCGVGVLLSTVVGWSVFGRLPTKLIGQQCILVKSGGVNLLSTAAGGRLTDLAVEVGDTVTRGQIIGRLELPDVLPKIEASEARLKEVRARYDQVLAVATQGATLRAATMAQQEHNLAQQQASAAQHLKLIQERIESQTKLFEQGLITKQTLLASQIEAAAIDLEIQNITGQIKQLKVSRLEGDKQAGNEVAQARNELEDAKRATSLLARDAKSMTAIVSPYAGRVLEIKANEGQLVERGTDILAVESSGIDVNELEAYVYLPAGEGKRVHSGMKVEISPSTARREEFGFMPAFVTSVADYPSTQQGLMRVFGNDKLVQQLAGTQAPIQIMAALKPASHNQSHYEWSTRTGPPFSIQSNTACSASISLFEQRPIALVIPMLKKIAGLE
jgi:HlyD family secretion protein